MKNHFVRPWERVISLLKKWKEGVRSKFSVRVFRGRTVDSPKIGPDPDFFNGLLSVPGFFISISIFCGAS